MSSGAAEEDGGEDVAVFSVRFGGGGGESVSESAEDVEASEDDDEETSVRALRFRRGTCGLLDVCAGIVWISLTRLRAYSC